MTNLTNVKWDEFPARADPRDQVSKNFVFFELTKSETAERHAIDNAFSGATTAQAAVYLCRNVLQAVRDAFGSYSPNSVYRSQALERALKKKRKPWVSKSQHAKGQACDIEIPGMSNIELAQWVTENLEFDQVILECFNAAKGPNSGWVHVSLKPPGKSTNRRQILSYVMSPTSGKYVYVDGLQESP